MEVVIYSGPLVSTDKVDQLYCTILYKKLEYLWILVPGEVLEAIPHRYCKMTVLEGVCKGNLDLGLTAAIFSAV